MDTEVLSPRTPADFPWLDQPVSFFRSGDNSGYEHSRIPCGVWIYEGVRDGEINHYGVATDRGGFVRKRLVEYASESKTRAYRKAKTEAAAVSSPGMRRFALNRVRRDKSKHAAVTPTGAWPKRHTNPDLSALASWTRLLLFEVDGLASRKLAEQVRDWLAELPGADGRPLCAFAALSLGGLGVYFCLLADRRPVEPADYLEMWRHALPFLERTEGMPELDTSGSDATRLRFIAHDPGVRINENPALWPCLTLEESGALIDGRARKAEISKRAAADRRSAERGF